jgi:crossover junction endodeoxyribonuclease RuvC
VSIVMGIDLSLTGTGVVSVRGDKREIVDQKLITSSPKEENTPRLLKISLSVMDRVNWNKPSLVVIEGPAFGISKTTSIFQLGELAGIVKSYLYVGNFQFIIVPPTSLKKWITGKGNAKKDLMLLAVYKKFGVDFTDDNLCDAYALAMYGFQFLNPSLKRRSRLNG